jgi:hypothetical protein
MKELSVINLVKKAIAGDFAPKKVKEKVAAKFISVKEKINVKFISMKKNREVK